MCSLHIARPSTADTSCPSPAELIGLDHACAHGQAFREDRTLLAAADFIAEALGQRFIESVPLNLERALVESAPNKPLICLLSAGTP